MLHRFLLLLAIGLLNPLALGGVPEVVAAARKDAEAIGTVATRTLYLSIDHYPAEHREELRQVLAFHVNSLSREAVLTRPREVTPELLAVNCDDYQWDRNLLVELFTASAEPYFHVVIEQVTPGGVYTDQYGRQTKRPDTKARLQAAAPWVGAAEYAALVKCCQTEVPILRADWFIYRTAIQDGRGKAGYYDFLGIGKKEADFHKLGGVNTVEAKRLKLEMAAVVARSGVTLNNRSITRMQGLTGAYYFTQDYRTSKDKQNTLRLLDGATEPPQGDASEQYVVLPNRLFAFGLFNDKGDRVDSAPDFIASDSQAHSTDRRVHVGLSCIRCHVEGLRPINDWARRVYRDNITLTSPDYAKLMRLRQLYLSDLPEQLADDQAVYARALKRANGLTPAANAKAYGAVYARYEADMTIGDVARELGCSVEVLSESLKGQTDPVMLSLLQKDATVRREHAEELWPLFYAALGVKQK